MIYSVCCITSNIFCWPQYCSLDTHPDFLSTCLVPSEDVCMDPDIILGFIINFVVLLLCLFSCRGKMC